MTGAVNNVKISVLFHSFVPISHFAQVANSRNVSFSNQRNFYIIKDTFPITIFKKLGSRYHLNVTGIQSTKHITFTLDLLITHYCFPESFVYLRHTIDNLTATYNLGYRLPLQTLAVEFTPCNYNTERFPGLHIKSRKGAVMIFSSGKVNILGLKSEQEVEEKWKVIQAKIQAVVTKMAMSLK